MIVESFSRPRSVVENDEKGVHHSKLCYNVQVRGVFTIWYRRRHFVRRECFQLQKWHLWNPIVEERALKLELCEFREWKKALDVLYIYKTTSKIAGSYPWWYPCDYIHWWVICVDWCRKYCSSCRKLELLLVSFLATLRYL